MEENINFELNKKENPLWKRTNFFISAIYLLFQAIIPGLILFFLTSRDFSFAYQLPLWLMFVLALSYIAIAGILTFITYKLKKHFLDQYTYVMPFVFLINGIYLTSYWLDYHYILVRFIIGLACAVLGILLTSMALLTILRFKKQEDAD